MTQGRKFTTFFAAKVDPNVDQQVARYESRVVRAYENMRKAADKASAGPRLGGTNNAQRGLEQQTLRTSRANQVAARSTDQLTHSNERLQRALRGAAISLNVVQGPLGPLAGRVTAVSHAIEELTGFTLGFAAVGATAFAGVSIANKYAEIEGRLKSLYPEQQRVNSSMKDLIGIARSSRQELGSVAELYVKIASVAEDVGIKTQNVSRITELAAKAAALSGGSKQTQSAGLGQFAQAIGSNVLQGEELKSIKENTSFLAQAIAAGVGKNIGDLKKLGEEGVLTAQVIEEALLNSAGLIEARYSRLPPTVGQALNLFSTNATAFIGQIDETIKATSSLAQIIIFVGDNISGLTTLLLGAGAGFAALRVAQQVQRLVQFSIATAGASARVRELVTANQQRVSQLGVETTALRATEAQQRRNVIAMIAEARAARIANTTARERVVALREQARIASGLAGTTTALTNAQATLTQTTQSLADAGRRATASKAELTGASKVLAASEARLDAATAQLDQRQRLLASRMSVTSRASASLKNAFFSVFSMTNLLTAALYIGVTALIAYAMRQDEAAAAADRMAQREAELAKYIDQTTGKLISQNAELRKNAQLKAQENYLDSAKDFTSAQKGLITPGQSATSQARFGNLPQYVSSEEQVLDDLGRGKISIVTARARLGGLRGKVSASRRQNAIERLDNFENVTTGFRRNAALKRQVNDEATKKDLELLGFSNKDTPSVGLGSGKKAKTGGGGGGSDSNTGASELDKQKAAQDRINRAAERYGEKRRDILQNYAEESNALAKARDQIEDLNRLAERSTSKQVLVDGVAFIGKTAQEIEKIKLTNPLGQGIYTKEMAANDAAAIEDGVRRPLRDVYDQLKLTSGIQALQLQGYDREAVALEKVLDIYRQIGEVPEGLLDKLIDQQRIEENINDQLASRQKILDEYVGTAALLRDSTAEFLLNLDQGPKAFGNFFKSLIGNFQRQMVTRFTEKLFGGTEAKLRDQARGGTDAAVKGLEATTKLLDEVVQRDTERREIQNQRIGKLNDEFGKEVDEAADEVSKFAKAVKAATDNIEGNEPVIKESLPGEKDAAVRGASTFARASAAISRVLERVQRDDRIIVTGAAKTPGGNQPPENALPEIKSAFKTALDDLLGGLDDLFGTKFLKGLSGTLSDVLEGAARGTFASSFAEGLGIKQSKTGAAIGGGIGAIATQLTGIPGLDIIGGLIGGTIGGIFKKAKFASSSIGIDQFGNLSSGAAVGNNKAARNQSNDAADSLVARINQISEALGGNITGTPSISIGSRDGNIRVDPTGRGETRTSRGAIDFGEDLDAAIAFAVKKALEQGVITGISAASQRILQSGQDLQAALEKATIIESIPRRLLAKTDPVRAAVQDLNREFERMIRILKEAGATDQQFSDAAALYAYERAAAIEAASQQAGRAIEEFLTNLRSGSDSPFSKRTTFLNAQADLLKFESDINSGKRVDEDALLSAARNFEEATSRLDGRGINYFDNLQFLTDLLTRARANTATSGGDLPASPFEGDAAVRDAIARAANGQVEATNNQTNVLSGGLQDIVDAITNLQNGGILAPSGGGGLLDDIPRDIGGR
jgi:tape measure domain-containing protein